MFGAMHLIAIRAVAGVVQVILPARIACVGGSALIADTAICVLANIHGQFLMVS